jgi:hypothetical protein
MKQPSVETEILKMVLVSWVDSSAIAGIWEYRDDFDDTLVEEKSVGFLISDDDEKVVICQSYSEHQYGQIFRIPRGCVKEINELRLWNE